MQVANIEWTGALCTILALVCATELVLTSALTFGIPHFLSFSKTQITTGAGLIAACVTLPTVIRIKTSKITPNMSRIYGYTIWYQRMAIGVCGSLHFTATIMALTAMSSGLDFKKEFKTLISEYHSKVHSKSLVDNIQWNLQCCGACKYSDWFTVDWEGLNFGNTLVKNTKKDFPVEKLMKEDTDGYPDLVTIRRDSLPFSCCKRKITAACVHYNIQQFGTRTINVGGCALKLKRAVHYLLVVETISYTVCVLIELAILYLLFVSNDYSSSNYNESDLRVKKVNSVKKSWSRFSNEENAPQFEVDVQTVSIKRTNPGNV